MVNACPKLYFIDSTYKITLYTDASDYAHGAHLCQVRPATETSEETEEPIRFLTGSFSGTDEMVHNREGGRLHILGT